MRHDAGHQRLAEGRHAHLHSEVLGGGAVEARELVFQLWTPQDLVRNLAGSGVQEWLPVK